MVAEGSPSFCDCSSWIRRAWQLALGLRSAAAMYTVSFPTQAWATSTASQAVDQSDWSVSCHVLEAIPEPLACGQPASLAAFKSTLFKKINTAESQ